MQDNVIQITRTEELNRQGNIELEVKNYQIANFTAHILDRLNNELNTYINDKSEVQKAKVHLIQEILSDTLTFFKITYERPTYPVLFDEPSFKIGEG